MNKLAAGQKVGRYEVARWGEGGNGRVYLASDTELIARRPQLITARLAGEPERRRRFEGITIRLGLQSPEHYDPHEIGKIESLHHRHRVYRRRHARQA